MKCMFTRAHAERLLVLLLLFCSAVSIHAYDFQVDGIYYTILARQSVAVTYASTSYNSYSGAVQIPQTVSYRPGKGGGISVYDVVKIGPEAFKGCTGLTKVTIPKSIVSIDTKAFEGCTRLTEVTINNNAIISKPYTSSSNLKHIFGAQVVTYNLGSDVTSIGSSAFNGCTGLKEVVIPSSVTSIDYNAFYGCTSLNKVHTSDLAAWCDIQFANSAANPLSYAHHLYLNGEEITKLVIPNSVILIDEYAFYGCTGLTEVTIPNSVNWIINKAFYGCTGLKEVTIPDSVALIGGGAFEECTGLNKVHISDLAAWCKIQFIDSEANPLSYAHHLYLNGKEITQLIIPNSVISIGSSAFSGCTGLTEVNIPNSVTSIGSSAFSGCTGLTEVTIPNSVTSIRTNPFNGCSNLGSITVAEGNPTYDSRDGCNAIIETNSSELLIGCKNTKISRRVKSIASSAFYNTTPIYLTIPNSVKSIGDKAFDGCSGTLVFEHTTPPSVNSKSFSANMKIYIPTNTLETYKQHSEWSKISMEELSITLPSQATPTTVMLNTSDTNIDNHFTFKGEYLTFNGKKYYPQNHQVKLTGLEPETTHNNIPFYGEVDGYITIEASVEFQTTSLEMVTSQPKVVSAGNVIVAAETNIGDDESNVGFEWRRTDWSDDFVSNTGNAYVYNGVMEGYIRNLYTEKLWKYRPYYVSAQGNYYYGEWVGIDPTNTSYFEPTVHTYASVSVNGNTAAVKGYALTGTDKVTAQGFKYWKTAADAKDRDGMNRVAAVPSDAMTIEASGQVMTATLVGLDYNATYHYAAFVTTAEGDTFYGEEQSFATGEDPSGIGGVPYSEPKPVTIVARYNMNGQPLSAPQKGINLLKMSDGTVKKVLVK